MHEVAHEVPVPTDGLERELMKLARKRFTGRANLTMKVQPEAGLSVDVLTETAETERPGERAPCISPILSTGPSENELLVQQTVRRNAYRLRLTMKLARVTCDFKEGRLNSAQWITVG